MEPKLIELKGAVRQADYCIEKINPNKQPLTVEILRTYKGCEHYSDEEAEHVVNSIKSLSLILLGIVKNNTVLLDNQVELNKAA